MKIRWKLRMAAAQREVWTGTQLRRLLAERAGLEMSAASVSALFTKEPAQVKLSTLAALCTALDCTPNDLFDVDTTPVEQARRPAAARSRTRRRPPRPGAGPCRPSDHAPADGQEAAGLRRVRRPGRDHRPRALLPVRAEDPRGRREGGLPGLREAAGPAGRRPAGASLCSRCCRECGHPVRRTGGHLVPGLPAQGPAGGAQRPCPRCGRPGYLREATGWCGPCSRPRQPKDPPRACAQCGQVKRHEGAGDVLGLLAAPPGPALRRRRSPGRPARQPAGLAGRVHRPPGRGARPGPRLPPDHRPGPAAREDGHPDHPQAAAGACPLAGPVDGVRWPARLEDFFTAQRPGPARPTRPSSSPPGGGSAASTPSPAPLRPAADGFGGSCSPPGERARRAGTRPRSDHDHRDRPGDRARPRAGSWPASAASRTGRWPTCTTSRRSSPPCPSARKRRLTVLRQFFRFARTQQGHPRRPHPGPDRPRAPRVHRPDPPPGPAARAVPPLDDRPRRPPARGPARNPRPAARRLQPRGPAPAR